MNDQNEREKIIEALRDWIHQRPGLDFANYGDWSNYRAEVRNITRDLNDARTLLRAVEWRDYITAEDIKKEFPRAFMGRLEWDGERLDYCTGQYWPTEYRKAACAVLASVLWRAFAADYPAYEEGRKIGDEIRARFRKEFGRGIQSRWFR